jgi:hypothetical protein
MSRVTQPSNSHVEEGTMDYDREDDRERYRFQRSHEGTLGVLTAGATLLATGGGLYLSLPPLGLVMIVLGLLLMLVALHSMLGLPGLRSKRGMPKQTYSDMPTGLTSNLDLRTHQEMREPSLRQQFEHEPVGLLDATLSQPGSVSSGQDQSRHVSVNPIPSNLVDDLAAELMGSYRVAGMSASAAARRGIMMLLKLFFAASAFLALTLIAAEFFPREQKYERGVIYSVWLAGCVVFWFGSAVWLGRKAGWRWGLATAIAWPLAIPIYEYTTSRGRSGRQDLSANPPFPVLKLTAGLLIVGLANIALAWLMMRV